MTTAANHALYALARDLITDQMALRSGELRQLRAATGNAQQCAGFKAQLADLFIERDALDSSDPLAIEATILKYARSKTRGQDAIDTLRQVVFPG